MANSKDSSNKSSSLKNESRSSIEKIKDFLSLDLSSRTKNRNTTMNDNMNLNRNKEKTEEPKKFEGANFQSTNLDRSRNNSINTTLSSQPLLSKHRLEQNKKSMQTDTSTSYIAHPQHVMTVTEVKPQQAKVLSEPKKSQARRAPLSASVVEIPKPPQLRSIEGDIALKAKKSMQTDTSTSYIAHPQHVMTVTEVKPQQAKVLSEPKKSQAIKTSPEISGGFDELDKLIDSFQGQKPESSKVDNVLQNTSSTNKVKSLISSFEQRTNESQLNSKKFYEDMYESLAPSEKAKTTKDVFLQNAKNHQINKIVQNMQRGAAKSADKVSPNKTPNSQTASFIKDRNTKNFSI